MRGDGAGALFGAANAKGGAKMSAGVQAQEDGAGSLELTRHQTGISLGHRRTGDTRGESGA